MRSPILQAVSYGEGKQTVTTELPCLRQGKCAYVVENRLHESRNFWLRAKGWVPNRCIPVRLCHVGKCRTFPFRLAGVDRWERTEDDGLLDNNIQQTVFLAGSSQISAPSTKRRTHQRQPLIICSWGSFKPPMNTEVVQDIGGSVVSRRIPKRGLIYSYTPI